jgi:hypothetical protein
MGLRLSCGMAVKRMGNVRSKCEEDKALTVKMEVATLTFKLR